MNSALVGTAPRDAISLQSIAGRIGLLPALLVLLVAGMSAVDAQFYGITNVLNILRNASLLAIVACGQALVIIAGGFDLSGDFDSTAGCEVFKLGSQSFVCSLRELLPLTHWCSVPVAFRRDTSKTKLDR